MRAALLVPAAGRWRAGWAARRAAPAAPAPPAGGCIRQLHIHQQSAVDGKELAPHRAVCGTGGGQWAVAGGWDVVVEGAEQARRAGLRANHDRRWTGSSIITSAANRAQAGMITLITNRLHVGAGIASHPPSAAVCGSSCRSPPPALAALCMAGWPAVPLAGTSWLRALAPPSLGGHTTPSHPPPRAMRAIGNGVQHGRRRAAAAAEPRD